MQMPWEISERSYAVRDLTNGRGTGKLGRFVGKPCPYCGERMERGLAGSRAPSRDHRLPTSRGGMHTIANLIVCCRRCNECKGSLDEEEFNAWKDGRVSRLDHGWWDRIWKKYPGMPKYPYLYYAKLWLKIYPAGVIRGDKR